MLVSRALGRDPGRDKLGLRFPLLLRLLVSHAFCVAPELYKLALSLVKLVLHPAAVALAAWALAVEPTAAGVMVAAAALPVAGNVYILAHHFRLAEEQVSAAILLSTAASILTLPIVIHLITKG